MRNGKPQHQNPYCHALTYTLTRGIGRSIVSDSSVVRHLRETTGMWTPSPVESRSQNWIFHGRKSLSSPARRRRRGRHVRGTRRVYIVAWRNSWIGCFCADSWAGWNAASFWTELKLAGMPRCRVRYGASWWFWAKTEMVHQNRTELY